ncbi:MAG: prefoldin subunit alpha [Methanomassiliicoccaceae archaeon]|jgi:prefoldin alpha subunit|nr:prefoldin subunit alpha [Methanomassiliicoccaceae archaeon]
MNDDELRQALYALDVYKAQLDGFAQQAQILQMSLEEAVRARETLKALLDAKEGEELLIPIGAQSFVYARAAGINKAIIGIGNRVSVEKELSDAATYMDGSVKEITEVLKKTGDSITEMDAHAKNISLAVQQEYQRRQQ